MNTIEEDIKSDRINDEVALFMGCTLKEITMVISVSLMLAMIITIPIVFILFKSITLGFAAGLVIMVIIAYLMMSKLAKLKRGKPEGYYQQYLKIKLSKIGIIKNPFLMRSGKWSTYRER